MNTLKAAMLDSFISGYNDIEAVLDKQGIPKNDIIALKRKVFHIETLVDMVANINLQKTKD